MGRPEAEIDWDRVEEFAMAGAPGTEIAAFFGVHANTLYKKVEEKYNCGFSEYLQEKKSKGEVLLRTKQYSKALGLTDTGDNTLLIWLGKQRLNQKENRDENINKEKIVFEVNYKNDSSNKIEILPTDLSVPCSGCTE